MAKLYFFHGTMGSGKSMLLLAKAYNFQDRKIPFLILKSRIDDRDGVDLVHSRSLGDKECIGINPNDNIHEVIKSEIIKQKLKFKWVLVDEAQFLSKKQIDELGDVVDKEGINVMCYGLRTDFKTELFPGSKRLFEIADTIEEIKSTCSCGNKTNYNARVDKRGNIITHGEQIEVGGDDRYVSICRNCYKNKLKNNN